MADSTTVTDFNIGHWFNVATITNVVTATKTFGIGVSNAFKDKTGTVITGNFFMNVLDSSNNKVERIYVPASGVSADGLTIGIETTGEVTRGLKPTGNDVSDGSSDYSFKLKPGMIVAYTVDPIILTEFKRALLGEISSAIKHSKRETFVSGVPAAMPVYADAATGEAAITPTNGDQFYATSEGVIRQYIGGAWADAATGSTPNASTTVAGKIELATAAERGAGTATGGTGAALVPTNDALVKTSSGAGDENKIMILDATGKFAAGFAPTLNQNTTGTAANLSGTPALPNGVTATTQSASDNSTKLATTAYADRLSASDFDIFTKNVADASTTQTVNHGLGVIPKKIDFIGSVGGLTNTTISFGTYVSGKQKSRLWVASVQLSDNTAAVALGGTTPASNKQIGVVGNVTSSSFDIVWTKTGTPTGSWEVKWSATA